jgi:WhiB family redox-sensing transcriptional regulator
MTAARLRIRGRWRTQAACRTADPELFFPVSMSGRSLDQVMEAKALCAACAVRPECLAFALETGQGHGIWGGLTTQERLIDQDTNGLRARSGREFLLLAKERGDQMGDEEDVRQEVRG